MPAPKSKTKPPPTTEDLLKRIAGATSRPEQHRSVGLLAMKAITASDAIRAFNQLSKIKPDGPRLALEFVARGPERVVPALLLLAAQALQDRANPVPLRLSVAGKLLGSLPDSPQAVGPIIRSVTTGLSRSKTLQRMIELQSRVDKCDALDRMVAEAERAVFLKCPQCRVKLTRPEFIEHLWLRHRLTFERGAAQESRAVVERAVAVAATSSEGADLDAAFETVAHNVPGTEPLAVLQAIAARQLAVGFPVPDELIRSASEADCGLCPSCLNRVPDPFPILPPPLALSAGYLSGDGHSVGIRDSATGRSVTLVSPKETTEDALGRKRRYSPRSMAVFAAIPVLFLAIPLAAILKLSAAPPFLIAIGLSVVGWLIYTAVRFTRKPLPRRDRVAVDVAWRQIVPKMKLTKANARWILRLCRTSYDAGSPTERVKKLHDLVEDLSGASEKGGIYWPALAAARLLQVRDGAEFGKDIVGGLLGSFEPFFLGELPAAYAEATAQLIREDRLLPDLDARRFGILLLGTAFGAGFSPLELLRVLRFLPNLRALLPFEHPETLKQAYAVFRGRQSQPWSSAGTALAIFELARSSPGAARRVLKNHPDALLRLEMPEATERELGEVVLAARGLIVGGKVLSDADGEAEQVRSPRGSGWMLALGSDRLQLERKLNWETIDRIVKWLRYRTDKLLPQAEGYDKLDRNRIKKVLQPLAQACSLCGINCTVRSGKVGEAWPPV